MMPNGLAETTWVWGAPGPWAARGRAPMTSRRIGAKAETERSVLVTKEDSTWREVSRPSRTVPAAQCTDLRPRSLPPHAEEERHRSEILSPLPHRPCFEPDPGEEGAGEGVELAGEAIAPMHATRGADVGRIQAHRGAAGPHDEGE